MRATKGKILIRFNKALLEKFDREKPRDLSWGRIIVNSPKDFDYRVEVSIEVGEIAGISNAQKELQVGEKVLISYLIFMGGRMNKNKKPQFHVTNEPSGDQIFVANDGTGHDLGDIYARITDRGIEPLPGYVMINEPKKIERIGRIWTPAGYIENRERAFWCTVLAVSEKNEEPYTVGDEILCEGGMAYEISTGKNDKPIYIIRPTYVLAKKSGVWQEEYSG